MAKSQPNPSPADAASTDKPDTPEHYQTLTAEALLEQLTAAIDKAGKLASSSSYPALKTHAGRKSQLEKDYERALKEIAQLHEQLTAVLELTRTAHRTVETQETSARRQAFWTRRHEQALDHVAPAMTALGQLVMLLRSRPDSMEKDFDEQQLLFVATFEELDVRLTLHCEAHAVEVLTELGVPVKFSYDSDGFFSSHELCALVGHFVASRVQVHTDISEILADRYVNTMYGVPEKLEQELREMFAGDEDLIVRRLGSVALRAFGVHNPLGHTGVRPTGRHDLPIGFSALNRLAASDKLSGNLTGLLNLQTHQAPQQPTSDDTDNNPNESRS